MADYKLINYELKQEKNDEITYMVLKLEMENSSGNTDKREYTLHKDSNYESLQIIDKIVRGGLEEAKTKGLNIGVSDYTVRSYVTLSLPSQNNQTRRSKEDHRFTAHKL